MNDSSPDAPPEIVVLDGATVRADMAAARDQILPVVTRGGAVVLQGFLKAEEVDAVRGEAGNLAKSRPAKWEPYTPNGPDFHHIDMHSVEDNQRRVREGRALRQRRFHLHKLFLWNEHSSGFDSTARNLIRLRNTLYDHDEAYAVDPASGFFTTIHVTHYRQGGDFICEHSDLDFHMRQGLDSPFEVLTLLSKKGKDYFTGGQFIRKGKTYYKTDEETDPGDVIIYDVSQPHGCAPVDPELPEDPEGVMGRWFMLVPPYRISKHMVVR